MKIRLNEFRLIAFDDLIFFKGTRQAFGFKAALTTISPLANLILNWRAKGKYLIIPENFEGEK